MCKPAVVPVIAVPHPFSALIWQITKSNLIKATKGLRNSSGKIMEVPNLIGTWTGSWFRIPNIPTHTPPPPGFFEACGPPNGTHCGLVLIACTKPLQCRLAASNHALISASPRALKAASIILASQRYDDAGLAFWSVKNCQRPCRSFVPQKPWPQIMILTAFSCRNGKKWVVMGNVGVGITLFVPHNQLVQVRPASFNYKTFWVFTQLTSTATFISSTFPAAV